jgi:hypothetical protein
MKSLLILALFFIVSFPSFSQTEIETEDRGDNLLFREIIQNSLIKASFGSTVAFSLLADIELQYQNHSFLIRYFWADDDFLGKTYNANEIALLYGRSTLKKRYSASFNLGPAINEIDHYNFVGWFSTKYSHTTVNFGLGFQGRIMFIPMKYLAIGLYGAGNVNASRSYFWIGPCLQAGLLR